MAVCAGIKRDGSRCTATVEPPKRYCWWHDPANSEVRRHAASRGGKGKQGSEIRALKTRLQTLADMVEKGQMNRADAAVISQIWNVYLRAISTELKVKEVTELEERLVALEAALEQKGTSAGAGDLARIGFVSGMQPRLGRGCVGGHRRTGGPR